MCRLQLNLNPSNWLVLEYFGLLGEKTVKTPTSTTTTPPITATPPNPKPPKISMEVIQAKINLETEMASRLRKIKNILGYTTEQDVSYALNAWDKSDTGKGHMRGHNWKDFIEQIEKDEKGNIGNDKNLTDCKDNITAAITEFFLKTVLIDKGKQGITLGSLGSKQQKGIIEAYMNDYKTAIDKNLYDDSNYKGLIEKLGLTIPA